jgi:hypothetical protein
MVDKKQPAKPVANEDAPQPEDTRKIVREYIEAQRKLLEQFRRKLN